jgi:hypothetical protein
MNIFVSLYITLLFVLLTPGVVTRLPPTGSKMMVAVVHGLIFALVYHFTHKFVWRATMNLHTGFEGMEPKDAAPIADAAVNCVNGKNADGSPCSN